MANSGILKSVRERFERMKRLTVGDVINPDVSVKVRRFQEGDMLNSESVIILYRLRNGEVSMIAGGQAGIDDFLAKAMLKFAFEWAGWGREKDDGELEEEERS